MLSGWKTLIFNTAVAVFGAFAVFDWNTVVDHPQTAGIIVSAIGVINVALRFFTTTPPGVPKDKNSNN